MSNGQQCLMPWAVSALVNPQYKLYSDLERLIGAPLNEDERIAFWGCAGTNGVFDRILNNRIYSRFIVGDQAIGRLCEMYIAMQAEAFWYPTVAWDVLGLYQDQYEPPSAYTIQVKHSKRFGGHNWSFETTDNSGARRYDMLACVGYRKPEVEQGCSTSHDLHPANTEVFLIPVEDITSRSLQISRTAHHEQSGVQNKYWHYNIRLHRDIKAAVQRVARGLPVHVNTQLTLFSMENQSDGWRHD